MQHSEQLTIVESVKRRWYLPFGDLVVLMLFASIGRASHEEGLTVPGVVETAAPFVLGWFVAASFMGAYRDEAMDAPKEALLTTARTWVVGIPLGLLFRAVYLRKGIPISFAIVALLTTLIMLILWRAGVALLRRR